jgi:hypothetical protein
MKYPDADAIRKLTQKLKEQGDISLEESDWVYSLFLDTFPDKKTFRLNSPAFDPELVDALEEWFNVVAGKIAHGQRGNFIFTIRLDNGLYKCIYPAKRTLENHGNFEDLCTFIMIDKNLHPPRPLEHLFTQDEGNFYTVEGFQAGFESYRAGMYYYPVKTKGGDHTFKRFFETLSPVMTTMETRATILYRLSETIFEVVSGKREVPNDSGTLGEFELDPYITALFMRRQNIPCAIASSVYTGESVFFVEKDKARIVKKMRETPFEMLVKDALDKKIIDETMAKQLLNDNPIFNFPFKAFVENSVKNIEDMVKLKMDMESARERAKDEDAWLEQTR